MIEKDVRAAIVARCREMNRLGLNQGTSGNISARHGEHMLITPSAIAYEALRPAMIVRMPLAGAEGEWSGGAQPSTEWRFHRDILRERPEIGAIVHCHATYATALSMLREPLPAAHYMIAAFGGPDVRCTAYAPFGSQELADLAVAGLEGRTAVLLGNHGIIAVGADLKAAMWRASELETLARMYLIARSVGRPTILSHEEIAAAVAQFERYGPVRSQVADRGGEAKAGRPPRPKRPSKPSRKLSGM